MAVQGNEEEPLDEKNLDERLIALNEQLEKVSKTRYTKNETSHGARFGGSEKLGRSIRLPAEFASGVIAGFMIGWGIDSFFSVSPWGIIVFTLLGFFAGILNLLRATGHIHRKNLMKQERSGKKNENGQDL